jgi:hypothetical protein
MRPSGTLQAPTTGSLEAMLRETVREEQIAAARRLPKDPVIQLPDAPVEYAPVAQAQAANQSKVVESQIVPNTAAANTPAQVSTVAAVQTQAVSSQSPDATRVTALQTDGAMPQPKSAAITAPQTLPVSQTADVASALKNIVSSPTNVSSTSLNAKQDSAVAPVIDVAPKSDASVLAPQTPPAASVIEVGLSPDKTELKVGEKQQLELRVKSDAPLGMAVMTLRFDPKVLKVNAISMGNLFANAKTAPTLTQSVDEHGLVLISIAPAAGSAVMADGTLINIQVEALAAGDSTLAFDLSNVHVVASDGRPLLLDLQPVKLMVK